MIDTLKYSIETWQKYWSGGWFAVLLAGSVIWLLVFRRKEKKVKYLLGYLCVCLFVFFCPVTAKIVQSFIGQSVYWRTLWIIPTLPVLCYTAAEILRTKKVIGQAAGVLAFLLVIVFCGKGIYAAGNYERVHNYQKVPDEVAGICELVNQDRGEKEAYLAADNTLTPYIRVYDASIKMPFGRDRRGLWITGEDGSMVRKNYALLYESINAAVLDYDAIGEAAEAFGVNYLVVKIPDEEGDAQLNDYGFCKVGSVGTYTLYKS